MRTTNEIVKELSGSEKVEQENSSIVVVQMGTYQRPRRTCKKPYVSVFKGNAIMTIPYGPEGFEFSFSVRKGLALEKMMRDGSFDRLLTVALMEQTKIDLRCAPIVIGS